MRPWIVAQGKPRPACRVWAVPVVLGLALGALLTLYSAAWADWLASTGAEVAPNFAEISVLDNRVLVDLEVDPTDFLSFFPDAARPSNSAEPPELPSPEGLRVALSVGTEDASMLDGKIELLELRRRQPRPVARRYGGSASQREQPLSEKVIFFHDAPSFGGEKRIVS